MEHSVKKFPFNLFGNGEFNCNNFENQKIERNQFLLNEDESLEKKDSTSDKELELDLLEAIQIHIQNKPNTNKPTVKPDNKTSFEDLSKYVSQGAIPKKLQEKSNTKLNKKLKRKKKQFCCEFSFPYEDVVFFKSLERELNISKNLVEKNANDFEESKNDKIKELKKIEKVTQNKLLKTEKVIQLNITNVSKPFLYIVPEDPSPYFTLPTGTYFVTMDSLILPPVNSAISHPKISSTTDFYNLKSVDSETLTEDENEESMPKNLLNNLGFMQSEKSCLNNINCNNINSVEKNNENRSDTENNKGDLKFLKKFEKIESALLLGDFDKIDIPIELLKCSIKSKINALRGALENLNLLSINEKVDPDLFSKNVFYNKQFGKTTSDHKKKEIMQDQFFTLHCLFPNSDHQTLKEEIEKCDGREDSFLKLLMEKVNKADSNSKIDSGFRLLLLHFPNYELKFLYYKWVDCLGNEEKIRLFIDKEKKINDIQQIILTELPEISLIEAQKKAENFVNDDFALENFLAEQRFKKKIKEQSSKMILMLPEKDPSELMDICLEFQGKEDLIDEYITNVQNEMKKAVQFLNMQSVLPDADPNFLKEKIEDSQGNDDIINILTNSLLEDKNYPKISLDGEKIKRQKLWQIYVDNFDVKDFLLETDNGQKLVFNDANEELVLEFFKTRYPTTFVNTEDETILLQDLKVSDMLSKCKSLDIKEEFIGLAYSNFKDRKFTKEFLQKVVFIDKRKEIEKYLEELKDRKKAEEFQARENNAFLQCPLCCDDEVVESNAGICSEGHVFCKNCIKRYITIKIGDGIYKFQCASENCNGFFPARILDEILPKYIFQKICFKAEAEDISKANVEGLEFCTACDFAYIPPPEEKIFFCQNPDCLKEICRKCKEDNHIPLRCEEVEREKDVEARKKIEETMSEKLIRLCPKCGVKFIKKDGCNKMTCSCGAIMCYICKRIITGYSHFQNNGGLCPLYTNNDVLHHTDVVNAGLEARDQILQKDPNIRIFHDFTENK